MPNTPEVAIAAARKKTTRGTFGTGTCLKQVRLCYGVTNKYLSAAKAWAGAEHKHRSGSAGIPRGVPVFWVGGSHGYGHIAISLGDGLCETTDFVVSGGFGVARIDDITKRWGLIFEGWTEDLNGVRVYTPPPPPPKVAPAAKVAPVTDYDAIYNGLEALLNQHGPKVQTKYTARRKFIAACRAALKAAPVPASRKAK